MHPFLSAAIGGALIGFSVVLLMFLRAASAESVALSAGFCHRSLPMIGACGSLLSRVCCSRR